MLRSRILSLALFAAAAAGCASAAPCSTLSQCDCYRRADCQMKTEACWCPSECDSKIQCVCGGGKFLSCAVK